MIETKTKKILRCDLCLKELSSKTKTKRYLPLGLKLIEFMFGCVGHPDLCKNCWNDIQVFIEDHRTFYKLKDEKNDKI